MIFLQERTMLIEPFLPSGFTRSGIWADHHDLLPKVFARVTRTSQTCHLVVPDDFIIFCKYAEAERRTYTYGKVYLLHEAYVVGVLRRDGKPWFKEDT